MSGNSFRPQIMMWSEFFNEPGDGFPPNQDPAFKHYKILAEGDSWFSFNDGPGLFRAPTNLLSALRFRRSALIVNCASPGDTMRNMSELARNQDLAQALSRDGLKWDALLISGGGNDMLDRAPRLLKSGDQVRGASAPEDFCDQAEIDRFLIDIQKAYRRIAKKRDAPGSPARRKPMIAHTYDFATPRPAPARFFGRVVSGPWLMTAFRAAGVPSAHWVELADYLLKRLVDALVALEDPRNGIPNFHVVRTLGVMTPALPDTTGDSNDWINEFHPNRGGYAKLAVEWQKTLNALLRP